MNSAKDQTLFPLCRSWKTIFLGPLDEITVALKPNSANILYYFLYSRQSSLIQETPTAILAHWMIVEDAAIFTKTTHTGSETWRALADFRPFPVFYIIIVTSL